MGFDWLSTGLAGALESGAIALVLGAALSAIAHVAAPRLGWRRGTAIGIASLATLVAAAGVDAWHLFYLGIVPLESPYLIQQTLASIHDPGFLGTRVVFEFFGAIAGVMLGWYVVGASPGRNS